MARPPLPPEASVVDKDGKFTPEWYQWLNDLSGDTAGGGGGGGGGLTYDEGTWTPELTFVTPGNLSVSYTTQLGRWTRVNRLIQVSCVLVTSQFTYSTASGRLLLTNLPFNAEGTMDVGFGIVHGGISQLGWTGLVGRIVGNSTSMEFVAVEPGLDPVVILASDTISDTVVEVGFTAIYETDAA